MHYGRARKLAVRGGRRPAPARVAVFYEQLHVPPAGQRGSAELILRTLGPIAGKITLAVLSLWFLIYGGFVLRSGADRFIVTIYPSSGPAAFSVTMGSSRLPRC